MPNDPLSLLFAALADPTRRAILARLSEGEATVMELAEPFDMTLPAVSKHLKVLAHAGLIEQGRQAQWRPCRLLAAPLSQVDAWVEQYRKHWEASFSRMDAYLRDKGIEPAATEGAIVDAEGRALGRHAGAHHFTVGQRKGLGIAAAEPLYVIATDSSSRTVTVGSNDDLLRASLIARDIRWLSWPGLTAPARVRVRIRNRGSVRGCARAVAAPGRGRYEVRRPRQADPGGSCRLQRHAATAGLDAGHRHLQSQSRLHR